MEVRVEGLQELRLLLRHTLPEHIQVRALHPALAKAARPIIQQARALAPTKTGLTRRSIRSWRSRKSTKTMAVRHISVKPRGAYVDAGGKRPKFSGYWRFVEFGHGEIKAFRGRILGTPASGFFGKSVKAAPARPFMRPAFESKKYDALEVFRRSLAGEIEKVAARYQANLLRRLRRKVTGI